MIYVDDVSAEVDFVLKDFWYRKQSEFPARRISLCNGMKSFF